MSGHQNEIEDQQQHSGITGRTYTSISTTDDQPETYITTKNTSEKLPFAKEDDFPKATPLSQRICLPNLILPKLYIALDETYRFRLLLVYRVWTSFPHETFNQYIYIMKNHFPKKNLEHHGTPHMYLNDRMLEIWKLFDSLHGVQLVTSNVYFRDIRPFEFFCFVNGIREIRLQPNHINTSTNMSKQKKALTSHIVTCITIRRKLRKKSVLLETLIIVYKLGQAYTEEELELSIHGRSKFMETLARLLPVLEAIYDEYEKISLSHGWKCWFEMISPYRKFNMEYGKLGFENREDIKSFAIAENYSFHPDPNELNFTPIHNRRSRVAHECFRILARLTSDISKEIVSMNHYFMTSDASGTAKIPPSIHETLEKMKEVLNENYKGQVNRVVEPPSHCPSVTSFPVHVREYVRDNIHQRKISDAPSGEFPSFFAKWPDNVKDSFVNYRVHGIRLMAIELERFELEAIRNPKTGEIEGIQTLKDVSRGDEILPFYPILTYQDHFERTAYDHKTRFGSKYLSVTKRDLVNYSFAIPFEDPDFPLVPIPEAARYSVSVTPMEFSCVRYMVQNIDGFSMDENGSYNENEVNYRNISNAYLSVRYQKSINSLGNHKIHSVIIGIILYVHTQS